VAVIRARAFAKINLTLRIVGTRPDGYHELTTTFQTVALHDTLTFTTTRGPFELRCSDRSCPADRTNLVWRAAEQVWNAAGRTGLPRRISVRLLKRIPLQAGLGGGSSDAAATLLALTRLWRVKLSAERLSEIAISLGADVPFFLQGGTAFGVGRGDRLRLMDDVSPGWVVLVFPRFSISTKDAYQWWDAAHPDGDDDFPSPAVWRVPVAFRRRGDVRNDLEPIVAERHPEIRRIVDGLKRGGAEHAAMSGSGSAVFGLFASRRRAESAAGTLRRQTRRTLVTRTLSRAEFRRRRTL
jgi:4-diphosphocytidyl-2-C-methyl-D-erythritol kinase